MCSSSKNVVKYFIFAALISGAWGWEWDDILWSEEESTEDPDLTTSTTTERAKRYDEESICDHDPLTMIIVTFILETKKVMKVGQAGLPPLDPFYLHSMEEDLVGTKHNYRVKVNFSDIYAIGLSSFNLTDISTSVLDMSANVSFYLDKFTFSGKYYIRGGAKIGILPIPVYAKGRVEVNSSDIVGSSSMEIGFNEEGDLVVKEFDFKMDMSKISVKFKGMTGALITRNWNEIINSMGLKMFRKIEPKIHDKIRARAILGINKALKEMDFDWEMWKEVLARTFNCLFSD